MGREIEHKYLVENTSYREMATSAVEIRQGYLQKDPERVVRVRTFGSRGYITVKGRNERDLRPEFEYEIPVTDAVEILRMALPGEIEKTRYIVNYKGYKWEVDEFHGRLQGLVTAEIELEESNHEYPLPPFVGRDVTTDPRYYNSNL